MSKKIEDLRKAATAAREAANAAPDDTNLAQAATAAEAALADAEAPAKPAGKQRKVRVIADQDGHRINDVVLLADAEATAAVIAGWADDSPAAVAFAESEAAPEA